MKKLCCFVLFVALLYSTNVFAITLAVNRTDESNDFPIHTTVYHNYQGKTLSFEVTFDIGYFNTKTGVCKMQKRRVFKATHAEGTRAKTLGKHLANEYGPKLYNCVHETLHVIDSTYPDESMTYQLANNGQYYTSATPNINDVYPR